MNKEIEKSNKLPVNKDFDPQWMRSEVASKFEFEFLPNKILRKLDEKLRYISTVEKKDECYVSDEVQELARQASMIIGLDNHYPLVCAVKDEYKPLAVEFANQLFKEYEVKSSGEKALVQVIINSYIQLLHNSRRYNNNSDVEFLSPERTKHLAMLGKQIDRANRQFLSALSMLHQMKSPPLNVNIKAHTAFIAQNQQLNNNEYENNDQ